MSAKQIDALMDIWAATLLESNPDNPQCMMPPFASVKHLYDVINDTPLAGIKWSKLLVKYSGTQPPLDWLPWMDQMFNVWFHDPLACIHNILENLDFKQSFNYVPYQEFQADNNE